MENASKAILIAGAVLIVLIVIGIAVVFVSKSNIITKIFSDDLSEQEIANHNAMFSMYDRKISGTQVISLLLKAEANNDKSDTKIEITTPAGNISSQNAGSIVSGIEKTHIYTASLFYDGRGVITRIEIL